jgi:hypothetical protein
VEAFDDDEPPPVPFALLPQPAERASVERTAPAAPARTKDTRSVLFCTSLLLTKVRGHSGASATLHAAGDVASPSVHAHRYHQGPGARSSLRRRRTSDAWSPCVVHDDDARPKSRHDDTKTSLQSSGSHPARTAWTLTHPHRRDVALHRRARFHIVSWSPTPAPPRRAGSTCRSPRCTCC